MHSLKHPLKEVWLRFEALPGRWKLWALVTGLVNGIFPFYFLPSNESFAVLSVFSFAISAKLLLSKMEGFRQVPGVMHLGWLPILFILVLAVDGTPVETAFGWWIRGALLVNATNLVLDSVDLVVSVPILLATPTLRGSKRMGEFRLVTAPVDQETGSRLKARSATRATASRNKAGLRKAPARKK